MVFAPALGIAACQVLAALCGVIAMLFTVLGVKGMLVGGEALPPWLVFLFATLFAGGSLVCWWFAKLIQRLARGD
jgi:hypothetical protein